MNWVERLVNLFWFMGVVVGIITILRLAFRKRGDDKNGIY